MQQKLKLATCLLFGITVGCGGKNGSGSGGGGPTQLSDKASRAFSGQTALFEASRSSAQGREFGLTNSALIMRAAAGSPSSKDQVNAKTQQASQMINPSVCKIAPLFKKTTGTDLKGANAVFAPMEMKISGASCPVEVSLKIDTSAPDCQQLDGQEVCHYKSTVQMAYQVLDDKLAQTLEVRSGHVNMSFDLNQSNVAPGSMSGEGGKISLIMKNKASIDFRAVDLAGQANLLNGSLDFDLKQNIDFGKMDPNSSQPPEMKFEIFGAAHENMRYVQESTGESLTLSAEFAANGGPNTAVEKYFINGQAVTSDQYRQEHEKFQNSMMSAAGGSAPTGGSTGSSTGGSAPTQPQDSQGPQAPNTGGGQTQPVPPVQSQPPSESRWVCMTENYSTRQVFVGYGSIEFAAKSRAEKACNDVQASCGLTTCEQREGDTQAWFCEIRNYGNNRSFNGSGASKLEATYMARSQCFTESGADAASCSTYATCARQ